MFCFSVESLEGDGADLRLLPSLRYAHSAAYLVRLASQHGFEVVAMEHAPVREDQGEAVEGLYVILRREASLAGQRPLVTAAPVQHNRQRPAAGRRSCRARRWRERLDLAGARDARCAEDARRGPAGDCICSASRAWRARGRRCPALSPKDAALLAIAGYRRPGRHERAAV